MQDRTIPEGTLLARLPGSPARPAHRQPDLIKVAAAELASHILNQVGAGVPAIPVFQRTAQLRAAPPSAPPSATASADHPSWLWCCRRVSG